MGPEDRTHQTVLHGTHPGRDPGRDAEPDSIEGVQIAVKDGDEAAAWLQKKDAVPVRVSAIADFHGPAAVPSWKLPQLGFVPTKIHLFERKHVMAGPPGENGWLRRVQEFIDGQRSRVPALLEQNDTRP